MNPFKSIARLVWRWWNGLERLDDLLEWARKKHLRRFKVYRRETPDEFWAGVGSPKIGQVQEKPIHVECATKTDSSDADDCHCVQITWINNGDNPTYWCKVKCLANASNSDEARVRYAEKWKVAHRQCDCRGTGSLKEYMTRHDVKIQGVTPFDVGKFVYFTPEHSGEVSLKRREFDKTPWGTVVKFVSHGVADVRVLSKLLKSMQQRTASHAD